MADTSVHVVSLLEEAIGKCCGAPGRAPLDRGEAEEVAGLLKAVSDPARLQLLSIIRAAKACSASVYDLTPALGLSQPTVSHHLKVLTEAGLLTRDRRGHQAWSTLVPERLAQIGRIFARPVPLGARTGHGCVALVWRSAPGALHSIFRVV